MGVVGGSGVLCTFVGDGMREAGNNTIPDYN